MAKKTTPAPRPPADADKLIRDLRGLGERRGWKAAYSSVDADGRVTVVFELPKEEPAQE